MHKEPAPPAGQPAKTELTKQELIRACEEVIGYEFRKKSLLQSALTHASSADRRVVSNERMEFLGDSVLALVVCERLFELFPDLLEGELTKIKSVVVSRRTCAKMSRALNLHTFLVLGRGMASQKVIPVSVMAAVFEAVIAAIFLDGGIEPARKFLLGQVDPEIQRVVDGQHGNYKSILQQLAQKEFGEIPVYEVLAEEGPDHSKSFKVAAVIASKRFPPAWGENKKEAQQRAAQNALSQIRKSEIPYPAAN